MESLPYCKELNQCSDCGEDYAAELKHKTNKLKETSNPPSPAIECSVNSTDREIRNAFCFKCLQAKENLKLEGQVNEADFDVYKSTNCRKIADYLEKDKDDNYFEEYLLPAKALSKFALLLGKCVTSFIPVWRTRDIFLIRVSCCCCCFSNL